MSDPAPVNLKPRGYKGRGMCASCVHSTPKQFWAGGPMILLCQYYAKQARDVSRNCKGTK